MARIAPTLTLALGPYGMYTLPAAWLGIMGHRPNEAPGPRDGAVGLQGFAAWCCQRIVEAAGRGFVPIGREALLARVQWQPDGWERVEAVLTLPYEAEMLDAGVLDGQLAALGQRIAAANYRLSGELAPAVSDAAAVANVSCGGLLLRAVARFRDEGVVVDLTMVLRAE